MASLLKITVVIAEAHSWKATRWFRGFHSFLGSLEGASSGHPGSTDGCRWGVAAPLLARWEVVSEKTD